VQFDAVHEGGHARCLQAYVTFGCLRCPLAGSA
jgi:hypothetical protein